MANGKDGIKSGAQVDRFKEVARALGCVDDEAAFDGKLKALARPKPEDGSKQAKPPKRATVRGR